MSNVTESGITPKERRELADVCGISEQYLYQVLTGRGEMSTEEAVRCEQLTYRRLRRWDTCQRSWARRWPELIGIKGAPPVPQPEKQTEKPTG